jgi:pimeloyl-ACP methyl ester carboxylesterase
LKGTTAGGAHYKIQVPDDWNGELVIWNHGFSLSPIGPVTDLGPLLDVQLLLGYAVAASSYRMPGWALFKSHQDIRNMVEVFESQVGTPTKILIYGASLGGAVTAAALERTDLDVAGALTLCGAVAGSRNWDGALDLRLIYDAVCEDIPEAAIPGGAEGLPKNSRLTEEEVETAVNACTGILEKRSKRTKRQKSNLKTIVAVSGLPETFLLTDMWYVTFGLSDLVHDRRKLRGKIGIGNAGVFYGDPAIDDSISRASPRKKPARKLKRNFTPKGKVWATKIVSIHTDKDGLVIVENESEWAAVVPPAQLTTGIVIEKKPSHCGFSPAELVSAWESLRAWVDGGSQPTVTDLQTSCGVWANLFGGPCRYDPAFEIPDMDSRVRPR